MVRVPKRALKILHEIGYSDFNCLREEPYSGVLLYDLGFHQELKEYGTYLRDFFKSYNIEEIVVIDPHTYELFFEVYRKIIPGFSFKIHLILDIWLENVSNLSLRCSKKIRRNKEKLEVTYHDPCIYAKRLTNTRINTPRKLIRSIEKVELTDTFNHGKTSKCCGGPLEFIFADLSKEISKKRLDDLKESGKKNIITSCPICYVSFRRVAGRDIEVIDLIDLLYESMEV